ncbi:hypothetical protein TAMA11512_11470 [Selenomonas sp. TAMA-11512]|uniref:hypothetical protein n=1 Tax=Selenomonas sp. TAMA-11512 TaxID=3095337 RepID=UPI00308E33A4|nr:hypothetical protein TAMA11512_11470 [Selenomonas sp. TAMA-11512]
MARQLKKIQNKVHPKETAPAVPPRKKGRDIFLLLMIGLVFFLMIVGWDQLPVIDRSMYAALSVSLILTFVMRQGKVKEPILTWITRASFAALFISLALFAYTVYIRYFAA